MRIDTRSLSVILATSIAFALQISASVASPAPSPAKTSASYGKIPLSFEANHGQTDASVQYLSHGEGYTLFLRPDEAMLALRGAVSKDNKSSETSFVRVKLAGANAKAAAASEEPQITRTNYFIGNDPAQWRTDIPNFGRVRYSSVYKGIDLVYYGNQRNLEHDFIVAPQGDPSQIALQMEGASSLRIDAITGDLILSTNNGKSDLRLLKPVTYQEKNGQRTPVPSSYKLLANNRIGFALGNYDHTQPLIIDPVLSYSTYLGGSGSNGSSDYGIGVAVDSADNAYVVGTTYSTDFPVTSAAFQTHNGFANTFVTKLNATGTELIYSTYLGGNGTDNAMGVALDSSDNVYIAGYTGSTNFPTTAGAFQTNFPGQPSVFVTKLNATGSELIYSTFLGGSNQNYAAGIAVDTSGNAYVAGSTFSTDFPTSSKAFQTANKNQQTTFVTKLNTTGTAIVYSTYLGGKSFTTTDQATTIAVDSSGSAYVGGLTYSSDFPVTTNAFQKTKKSVSPFSGFLTKLNSTGSALIYSTYLGGSGATKLSGIFVDTNGDAYVTGNTGTSDFPVTTGAFQTTKKSSGTISSAFVTELNPSGSDLVYSTFLGGSGVENANAITVDSSGNAYVAGVSNSNDFPTTTGAFQTTFKPSPLSNGFLTKLNASGTELTYSTYFGQGAQINGIALDEAANVFLVGRASSLVLPVSNNAVQTHPKTSVNTFVAKFAIGFDSISTSGSTTTLSSSLASGQTRGLPLSGTVKVTPNTAGSTPTGSVQLTIYLNNAGGSVSTVSTSTVSLDSTGGASISIPTSTFASQTDGTRLYTLVAQYGGNPALDISTDQQTFTIAPNTKLSLTSSASLQYIGQPVTLTAIAKPCCVGISGIPTGTVTFSADTTTLSTVPLDSNGHASLTTNTLTAGQHNLLAVYNGDANFSSAQSTIAETIGNPRIQVVSGPTATLYGNSFAAPLVLKVTNGEGANFAGQEITFSGTNLTFSPASAIVDSNGLVQTSITPAQAGNFTATASFTQSGITTSTTFALLCKKASLQISTGLVNATYGGAIPTPTIYALTGFVNGDTQASAVTGAPVLSTPATSKSPAGIYPINIDIGTLAATNYIFPNFLFKPYHVQIYKAPLTGTIQNVTIHRGDPIPPFTFTWSGFVNGDTAATAVSGQPILTTTAHDSSKVGRYLITGQLGTLSSQNYYFIPVNGVLTILP